MSKKIAICHYRVGGTDGVSLEIEKRKTILEKRGYEVKLIAGNRSDGADYTIDELEWDGGIVPIIKENGFLYFGRGTLSGDDLQKEIEWLANSIRAQLRHIQKKEQFDMVLTHNIFSFGGHIAAAKAFAEWIKEFNLSCIATHHDFYWERKEFHTPKSYYLKEYLKLYMPPNLPSIKHVVINSLAKQELKKRSGINATIIPDVFDFGRAPMAIDGFNKDFLQQFDIADSDLVILQATRVIPRKGIEIAIDFVQAMQERVERLRGKTLYNGKKLGEDANVVLIIAGYAEDEKKEYLYKLRIKAFEEHIHTKFTSNRIRAKRSYVHGSKTYSLWDAYAHADLVTFPSLWEGWGNQFIEAVFAKKPIALFEYPVYKKDIKPEGYEVISFGNAVAGRDQDGLIILDQKRIQSATDEATTWITDPKLSTKLEKNFSIGRKNHNYTVIETFLTNEIKRLPAKDSTKEKGPDAIFQNKPRYFSSLIQKIREEQ